MVVQTTGRIRTVTYQLRKHGPRKHGGERPAPAPAQTSAPASFTNALNGAMGSSPVAGVTPAAGGDVGSRMVQIAKQEIGQSEQPPGSNNSAHGWIN